MLHLNTDPPTPARKPCLRDLSRLVATLLPPALVMLVPEPELERRCREIDLTHPQYREETPLVLRWERQRRQRLSGGRHVVYRQAYVA